MEIDNCSFQTRFRVSQSNSSVGYTHVLCCPCCMFFTLSFASLHKHALAHESSQLSSYRTYTCSKCLSTSTEKYLMLEHVNIYHRNTKRPVELTEEIHTILRKPNTTEEIVSPKIQSRKMDWKKKKISSTFRTYSKLQRKFKLRSRLYKYSMENIKTSKNELFNQEDNSNKLPGEDLEMDSKISVVNDNEPIDMTVKNDVKKSQILFNEKKTDESESIFTHDYSAAYQNIRSHLYDVMSKNPLPTGLSQSVMLRYLTAQFQSLQATKYFNANRFLSQTPILAHPDSNLPQRAFNPQQTLSVSKIQETNSFNPRNLHRNNFSPYQNHILLEWYDNHKQKPYPSTEETKHLATLCGLSYPQVKKWFANKRARSSFYQKDDVIACHSHSRYNLLKFPIPMSSRLSSEVGPNTMEKRFSCSVDNSAVVSGSSQEDSIAST